MFRQITFFLFGLAFVPLACAQRPVANASMANPPAVNTPGAGNPAQGDPVMSLLRQAYLLLAQKQPSAALDKMNAAVQIAPQNPAVYALRGTIYVEQKLLDPAQKDFEMALQLDSSNTQIKFDLAEIQFMRKKYDVARADFAALTQDPDLADIASYKVFLCDLFGGHEDAATKELDAFNQAGRNASYYFANVAWSLYHHKTDDATSWLESAANIYPPAKCLLYATSLYDLGYLPLTIAPQKK
ncbi:MAG TPA: tetratricopeptide repeat protein [Candidatus Methylacidiphilales bacterium]|nr:tetratricopeptide repeat protein [Candidatus Methylacidiphilales bacterium]